MTTARFKLYLQPFSVALNISCEKCLDHYSFLPRFYLIPCKGRAAEYVIDLLIKWFLYRVKFRKTKHLKHATISSYQAINMHSRIYECLLSRRNHSHHDANVLPLLGVPLNISDFQTWCHIPAHNPTWDFRCS